MTEPAVYKDPADPTVTVHTERPAARRTMSQRVAAKALLFAATELAVGAVVFFFAFGDLFSRALSLLLLVGGGLALAAAAAVWTRFTMLHLLLLPVVGLLAVAGVGFLIHSPNAELDPGPIFGAICGIAAVGFGLAFVAVGYDLLVKADRWFLSQLR